MTEKFKKKLLIKTMVISLVFITSLPIYSCSYNKQIVDLNYHFNQAIIKDIGTIEIKSWNDYENSDMVQIIGIDGTVYLTHSSNVILINKP